MGAGFRDPRLAVVVTSLRLYPVAAALCRPFQAQCVPTLQMRKLRHRKFKLAEVGYELGSVAVSGGERVVENPDPVCYVDRKSGTEGH